MTGLGRCGMAWAAQRLLQAWERAQPAESLAVPPLEAQARSTTTDDYEAVAACVWMWAPGGIVSRAVATWWQAVMGRRPRLSLGPSCKQPSWRVQRHSGTYSRQTGNGSTELDFLDPHRLNDFEGEVPGSRERPCCAFPDVAGVAGGDQQSPWGALGGALEVPWDPWRSPRGSPWFLWESLGGS